LVTNVKPKINLIEVHPQLNNIGQPMNGALIGVAGSLWPCPGASTPCTGLLKE
jgi:hypothetical protein